MNEIVGADREEIDLPGEQIGRVGRSRDFNHHADRHPRHDLAAPREIGGRLGHHAACFPQLLDARHEREHDAQLPVSRRPEQRAQLHLKQLGSREAQSEAAQTLAASPLLVRGPSPAEGFG